MEANSTESEERGNVFTRILPLLLKPQKVINNDSFFKALPFIFFLSFIAMLYISNSYYAEKTIREIDKANNQLKELRSEFISTKSDLMLISKQSEVAKAVAPMQLKESVIPPKKIIIREKSKE